MGTYGRHLLQLGCGACVALSFAGVARADRNAGIFYSTLYAKTMEPERISGFGGDATARFLKDVDGDGREDAVAYYGAGGALGQWHVALSDGTNFGAPSLWLADANATTDMQPMMGDVDGDGRQDAALYAPSNGSWYVSFSNGVGFDPSTQFSQGNGVNSTEQFLQDVDGDGDADAIIAWRDWQGGVWYVGRSNGVDEFGQFTPWISGFGAGSDQRLMGDADGDGDADAIICTHDVGEWRVALCDPANNQFLPGTLWNDELGQVEPDEWPPAMEIGFVHDIDGDGHCDIAYQSQAVEMTGPGEWWACYSDGAQFGPNRHRWITGLGQNTSAKSNPPPVTDLLIGSISAGSGHACIVDEWGRWFAVDNPVKNQTFQLNANNTYVSWRCAYEPQLPGYEGTYDSGDPVINDLQIQMVHDAGFTYIMFDITNGYTFWVDDRAQAFTDRLRHWNQNLQPGQHPLYATIALGKTRQIKDYDAFFEKLEEEAQRCWDEFYGPNSDVWYFLNGKPLLVHMVGGSNDLHRQLDDYTGPRWHIDQFSNRWMEGGEANSYGWIVADDNAYHPEMMPVMPGFWNGGHFRDRDDGEFYRNHWRRVLQYQPDSVWVNSLNETWEHTSIEPSYMFNWREPHAGITPWTDAYGDRMDDFYWQMTERYMKIYMDGDLYDGTYLQEHVSGDNYGSIYRVDPNGFVQQGAAPHQAPVLAVPAGFISGFAGDVVPLGPPATPTGLTATAGHGQATLDWADNSEPDFLQYVVYQATASGGPYVRIGAPTESAFVAEGLIGGATYYYAVTAVDEDGRASAYSAEASTTPQSGGAPIATLQAEDGLLARAVIASGGSGWHGSGYVDLGEAGSVQWTVSMAAAGAYDLHFTVAGDASGMAAQITVNGAVVNPALACPDTDSWNSNWQIATETGVSLNAGANTIRFADAGDSQPSIDQLEIIDPNGDPLPGDCDGDGQVAPVPDGVGLAGCLGGPEGQIPAGCDCYDASTDDDVDLADLATIQPTVVD